MRPNGMSHNIITGYVYNAPNSSTEAYHCVRCGQILIVVRGSTATWTSSTGIPYQHIALDATYLEHVCPRCHREHRILIQNAYAIM